MNKNKTLQRKDNKQLEKQLEEIFALLEAGRHMIEIMSIFKLSKVQFKSYLADFLEEVIKGNKKRVECAYEAFAAASLPKELRKLLAANDDSVIKAEEQEGCVLLSLIDLGHRYNNDGDKNDDGID